MKRVQEELSSISDLAARQTIDSTAAYREFLRVREELQAYQGSMHWKRTGAYEYLVHKKHGRSTSLGARSAETEARLQEFVERKHKLQQRLRSLKETVETAQRMNKAVRAGSVPSPVVDVLSALDEAGLGRESLVIGDPALYAYTQSSGLQADRLLKRQEEGGETHHEPTPFVVLVEMGSASPEAVEKLRHSVKGVEIECEPLPAHQKLALKVSYSSYKAGQVHRAKVARHAAESAWGFPCVAEKDGSNLRKWALDGLFKVLEETPKFEQVVIGKTGRMAMMRTVDPMLFVALSKKNGRATAERGPAHPCRSQLQADLVSKMVDEYWIASKLDEDEFKSLSSKLHEHFALLAQDSSSSPTSESGPLRKTTPKSLQKLTH